MLVAILKNEETNSHLRWVKSCDKLGVQYDVIDITRSDWLEKTCSRPYNFYLLRPPGEIQKFKTLFDERIYILAKILRKNLFPKYEEVILHENKKLLSYFLEATNIPHPKTKVFYYYDEALRHINACSFPIVVKTSIGSSATGVQVLHDLREAKAYLGKAFSFFGIRRRIGPNRVTGTPSKWLIKTIKDFPYFLQKLSSYKMVYNDAQRGFLIIQEFIPHDFEWRVVRIGDSFFGHKKIKYGEKASGTKGVDYVETPIELLDYVREITNKFGFNNMAIDLFEKPDGSYLVNEMQTVFGHIQDYICSVNDKPGRYLFANNSWMFEPGDFNTNESYDLRLEAALQLFNSSVP